MFYYLFQWLHEYEVPGARLMSYVTFRSGLAFVLAMLIAVFFGRKIINMLQRMQVGETIRNLGLEGQMKKTGTPTMGGVIIIAAIIIPCLLVSRLCNVYMWLMIVSTLWLGTLGFIDDYKKIKHHDKEGMKGRYKIVGQVGIGLIVGLTMWLSPEITVRPNAEVMDPQTQLVEQVNYADQNIKAPITTIPFVKNNNFDYRWLTSWLPQSSAETAAWIVMILIIIFFVAATSNGANLTDGIDGLATGCSAIIGVALTIMAYLGANLMYASYLNIMYVPGSEELVVYMAAFVGALVGFLWYNAYPAQVFMGDTGSLTLGGIIAVFAILTRKELLLPILCGIFYVEDLSVALQVMFFRFTKARYGKGRRLFKMAPLHHHFQREGGSAAPDVVWNHPVTAIPESKITVRFWIICIILVVVAFVTLKIR